jgi:hypothetical protein
VGAFAAWSRLGAGRPLMSIRWTPSQDRELRRLLACGLTYAEIAAGMQVTPAAARHRAHRMGKRDWTRPPSTTWTPQRDAMLRQLIGEGLSRAQIAERMDVCKTTVTRRWLQLHPKSSETKPPQPKPLETERVAHAALEHVCRWVPKDRNGMPRSKCRNPAASKRLYCWGHCAKAFERGLIAWVDPAPARAGRMDRIT